MVKKYRGKILFIAALIAVLFLLQGVLLKIPTFVNAYSNTIFSPFQAVRNKLFQFFSFSLGDWLYVLGGILIVYTVIKWFYYFFKLRNRKQELLLSVLRLLLFIGCLYLILLLSWGGNYYKKPLAHYWNLPQYSTIEKTPLLLSFDRFLIAQLNHYASLYEARSFDEINQQARQYVNAFTLHACSATLVKPSLFGNGMEYLNIQGYYNPFTGEAQVNKNLPAFMLPFVICHEMAHQQGIAAEDDANLLSYAICTLPDDPLFRYAAYFNIWLYTHQKLRRQNPLLAQQLKATLNPVSQEHLKALKALRKKYETNFTHFSGDLYDGFLKLQQQEEGINSYNKVWWSAWCLEQQRKQQIPVKIVIP